VGEESPSLQPPCARHFTEVFPGLTVILAQAGISFYTRAQAVFHYPLS